MRLIWRIFLNPLYRKLCFAVLTAIFLVLNFILLTHYQTPVRCIDMVTHASRKNIDETLKLNCNYYVAENCPRRNTSINSFMPSLTLFTSFEYQEEKLLINMNTLNNWKAIRGEVNLVLFTNTSSLARLGTEAGFHVFPLPKTGSNVSPTGSNVSPVIKSMYITVIKHFKTSFYAMANADILFDVDLFDTLSGVSKFLNNSDRENSPVLVVGRRTNIEMSKFNLTFPHAWKEIVETSYFITKRFAYDAIDYFIVNRSFPWKNIPDFVLGRRGYDNWLLAYARYKGFVVIDATPSIIAIHQTSALGNFESFLRDEMDRDYNIRIINELNLPYLYAMWGRTICCELRSVYRCGEVVIEATTDAPKYCHWFTYRSSIKALIGIKETYFE